MMVKKANLSLVVEPEEYFHELVTHALEKQRLRPQAETEFYLVQLLKRFISADNLYQKNEDGSLKQEPLALMIKEALETSESRVQLSMFRHIGDVSLYTAGFFQDSLSRKIVDVDYYIGVGGSAYQRVAVQQDERKLRGIYQELAEKFSAFVDVLARISDLTGGKTEKDLLRIYETWVKTGSDRAAQALQEAGIVPNATVKKDWQ